MDHRAARLTRLLAAAFMAAAVAACAVSTSRLSASSAQAPNPPQPFAAPLSCGAGYACAVIGRPDHGGSDHRCGKQAFPGELGTTLAAARPPVGQSAMQVLAAAKGSVREVYDERSACRNGLAIDHGGGWETRYCFLSRRAPLSVGQRLNRGRVLGLAGDTPRQFPGIVFEVRHAGQVVDPFNGAKLPSLCGVGRSLWTESARTSWGEREVFLLDAGFSDAPLRDVDGVIPLIAAGKAGERFLPGDYRNFWIWTLVQWPQDGDVVTLRVTTPAGRQLVQRSSTLRLDRGKSYVSKMIGFGGGFEADSAPRLPAGLYLGEFEIARSDETRHKLTRAVCIGCARKHLMQAVNFLTKADQTAAREEFVTRLLADPDLSGTDRSKAFALRAMARLSRAALDEAKSDLEAAVAADPLNLPARLLFGGLADRSDRSVVQVLREGVRLTPDSAAAHAALASALTKTADYREALRHYDEAIRLEPGEAKHRVGRSIARLLTGSLRGALADTEEALRLAPDDPTARLNRASLRVLSLDLEGARADVEAIPPDKLTADRSRTLRARILYGLGEFAEAAGELDALGREEWLKPSDLLLLHFALRRSGGDGAAALDDLLANPAAPPWLTEVARFIRREAELETALSVARAGLAQGRGDRLCDVMRFGATELILRGQKEEAAGVLIAAMTVRRDHGVFCHEAFVELKRLLPQFQGEEA